MSRAAAFVVALLTLVVPLARAADGDLLSRKPVPQTAVAGVELSRIVYESDGLKVHGYLAAPEKGEGLPCVIFNRGGNREFGALDDAGAAAMLGSLAKRGYVAVASQYRGNAGGEGREEFGGAEVADVLNLIPLLESLPRADASRIGMVGWSRGGMMTYLSLTKTDRIRAAIVGGGLADSFAMIEDRPEMEQVYAELVPGWPEGREAALVARSAVRWPGKLSKSTPILLLHGTADWRVRPQQALRMADALLAVDHPFRLMMLEGGDHGLTQFSAEVDAAIAAWLDRHVK